MLSGLLTGRPGQQDRVLPQGQLNRFCGRHWIPGLIQIGAENLLNFSRCQDLVVETYIIQRTVERIATCIAYEIHGSKDEICIH
ncbi:hypothetical protein ES703_72734 [subsurface metagenome]